jgi:hypothetical protein
MPQPYQRPTGDDTGTALKLTAIVIVVVLILAFAFVAIMMDRDFFINSEPTEKVTVNLASPNVSTREIANVTHWDAVLNFNQVTPSDSSVPWTNVLVTIRDADGSMLLASAMPLSDDPFSYDDAANGWVDVEVWFIEVTFNDSSLDAGDALKVTGMDVRYEGATIDINNYGDRIGSITLPTNFP